MPNNKKDFRLLIKAISTPGKLEKEETGVNIILTKIVYQIKRIDINYSIFMISVLLKRKIVCVIHGTNYYHFIKI